MEEYMETKKHIHMIYRSSDGKIHCEQYSVVYRNKHYIYYKHPGHDRLDYISEEPREKITLEDIDDITTRLNNHKWARFVTWFIDDTVRDTLIHTLQNSELAHLYDAVDRCEHVLTAARIEYERAEHNYKYALSCLHDAKKTYEV